MILILSPLFENKSFGFLLLQDLIVENSVNLSPNENQRLLSVCITHKSTSRSYQKAGELPRDREPFLEMLLNHHNPPKVFAFKVLLVSTPPPPPPDINYILGSCRQWSQIYLRVVPG